MPVEGWTTITLKLEEESKLRSIARKVGLKSPREGLLYLLKKNKRTEDFEMG